MMSSPYDPCGKFYTILSEEWSIFLWFEPVFIPQAFREHLVLVLGWTTGRRGYVSTVSITPDIPDGMHPDHYIRIRAPRRRSVADENTVTLRKNKTVSALVEHSYVRLDWVCEVPFAILLGVPRTGLQLMLRTMSMEKIMSFYSKRGWDQAWGQTHLCPPGDFQWAGYCHDKNTLGLPGSIRHGGEAGHPHMTIQPCHILNGLASSAIAKQDRNVKYEVLARSASTGSWDTTHRPGNEGDGYSEEEALPCTRQEMVYAGDAHVAALAKLLRQAR